MRRNLTSAEEDLMALALRTKPHTNSWLFSSLRVCALGEDAFADREEKSRRTLKDAEFIKKTNQMAASTPG